MATTTVNLTTATDMVSINTVLPGDHALEILPATGRRWRCLRGHQYKASSPFEVAVGDDPSYKSPPICPYCYVDFHKQFVAVEVEEA